MIKIKNLIFAVRPAFIHRNLINHEHKLIIGWTPKAACTVATKLFFSKIGQLEKALNFNPWIHKYRQVYQKNNVLIPTNDWKPEFLKIKFVRNPYTRAVSGYTHAMIQKYLDKQLSDFFKTSNKHSISFNQYLDYVEAKINKGLDAHNNKQFIPEEKNRFPYDKIVKIETLEADLHDIKQKYGVHFQTNQVVLNSHHHRPKINQPVYNCANKPFETYAIKKGKNFEVPTYEAFYNEITKNRIEHLFAADFEAYNYAKELIF